MCVEWVKCTCCNRYYDFSDLSDMSQMDRWAFWSGQGCPAGKEGLSGIRSNGLPLPVESLKLAFMRDRDLTLLHDTVRRFDSM